MDVAAAALLAQEGKEKCAIGGKMTSCLSKEGNICVCVL